MPSPWPVRLEPIDLYRGDRRYLRFPFFDSPPAWATATAYVVGVVGADIPAYLANSTVIFGKDAEGIPVRYTCTEAHTSGASFDPTKWAADTKAVGAPVDLTAFGATFTAQARTGPDAALVAQLEVDATEAATGALTITLNGAFWTAATGVTKMGWDMEADGDTDGPLTLVASKFTVDKDFDHPDAP